MSITAKLPFPRSFVAMLGLLTLVGCGEGPAFECTCSGADVVYQADQDTTGIASQQACDDGYEFAYLGDDGQTAADAGADAEGNCCDPAGSDCSCSCTAL